MKHHSISVEYTVRRSDIASMYLGSWGARIAMAPGILLILIGIPTNPKYPLIEAVVFIAAGIALLLAAPLLLCGTLMSMYQTERLVGRTVQLVVDDNGVRGWPLAEYIDTTWPRIRKARRFRGVVTLPFRQFGTRAGWVPIPERALSPDQRLHLQALLTERGLL